MGMLQNNSHSLTESEAVPSSLPNFLVVGAGKSGTTSLYHYLVQHPEIYMPRHKEPEFFAAEDGKEVHFNSLKGWHKNGNRVNHFSEYKKLFEPEPDKRARGEASAVYLYLPEAAHRIREHIPNATIIAILRNPVERAYSAYLHHRREDLEDRDFAEALLEENTRIKDNWSDLYHYRNMGYYYEQLNHYYDVFGADRVHVYLYDDLVKDPVGLAQEIFRVLGVDPTFRPDVETRHNIGGVPKNKLLHRIHHFLMGSNQSAAKELGKKLLPRRFRSKLKNTTLQTLRENNLSKPTLPQSVREDLLQGYRDDIMKLQNLIQRDLSHWLHK